MAEKIINQQNKPIKCAKNNPKDDETRYNYAVAKN